MAAFVLVCGGVGGGGCAHPREPIRFDSPDVNVRIAAIRRAARTKDKSAAPQLVLALSDDDPAVRFYAIEALRRLTGDRKGYDYFDDDPDQRRPAVERWRTWVIEQGMTMPDSAAATTTTTTTTTRPDARP
jgi:hypothetical protein